MKTKGMVHAIYEMKGHFLGATTHLIERKYTEPADGYMGYDFLCPYGVLINMSKMCIQIDLKGLLRKNYEKYELKCDEYKEYYVANFNMATAPMICTYDSSLEAHVISK